MAVGLSDKLKSEFSTFKPVERPQIKTENILNPNWISGFVSGDGYFDVKIIHKNKIDYRVQLTFRITQHERDKDLMKLITKYFESGNVYKYPNQPAVSVEIINFSDINDKIIPFFEQNPLHGVKLLNFLDWCKVAKMMKENLHNTSEGLNAIRLIKSGMNKSR